MSHLGYEKCLLRAKELYFWPELNNQLKNIISNCQACLTYRKGNSKEELCPHDIPNKPWLKVGTDLFWFNGNIYLLVVDYYSKFIEIVELKSTLSTSIINHIKGIFSRYGIPETLVSDGGPQFSSTEFANFSREWCFSHVTTSPYNSQSNGQAERAVQTIKYLLKICSYSGSDYRLALIEYLNTPINNNLPSPSEILLSRKLRSVLPDPKYFEDTQINPVRKKLQYRQNTYKTYYDLGARNLKPLDIGQKVKIRDLINKKWVPGVVEKLLRNRTYEV